MLNKRRVKIIEIDQLIFKDMVTQGRTWTVEKGLPKDAVLVGVQYNLQTAQFQIAFEHSRFPETEPGCVIVPDSSAVALKTLFSLNDPSDMRKQLDEVIEQRHHLRQRCAKLENELRNVCNAAAGAAEKGLGWRNH